MATTIQKTIATGMHLSTLSQFIIPFGNIIFPGIIWAAKRKQSELIDREGKKILNFQLSFLIYEFIISMFAIYFLLNAIFSENLQINFTNGIDFLLHNQQDFTSNLLFFVLGVLLVLFIVLIKLVLTVLATVKTSASEDYKYPLAIKFFK